MIRSWKYGIMNGLKYWPLMVIIYIIQFVFAGFIAIKFSNIIQLELWQSLNFKKLLTGYDHGIISDFRRVFAEDLEGMNFSLIVIIILYLILSILLNGGLIGSIHEKKNSVRHFFKQGFSWFIKVGSVVIISLVLLAVWAAITLFPLTTLLQKVMDGIITEPQFLMYFLLGGSAFYLGFCLIFCWSVISRMYIIGRIYSFWNSMRKSFFLVIKRALNCIGLISLFVLLQVVLILMYLFIENNSGMISASLVALFFIIQQLYVLIRIGWRIMLYLGIEHSFLQKDSIEVVQVPL